MSDPTSVTWSTTSVKSPKLDISIPVIAAVNLSGSSTTNERQNVDIYIPHTSENIKLVGTPANRFSLKCSSSSPKIQVHIHGGAWRDPNLDATSIEAAVAHAFNEPERLIDVIISINYTLSPFPTHPTLPYDPSVSEVHDSSREAQYPVHVRDVLGAFAFLRSMGLEDYSYILTGHSAGACLAFQSMLVSPAHHGLDSPDPPMPKAILGMNGLYDLPDLVDNLGESHKHLNLVYDDLIGIAFGTDRQVWENASPARFDRTELLQRLQQGHWPALIVLDQSADDELVPLNQCEKFLKMLSGIEGIRVAKISRLVGQHAAPWKQGDMLWLAVRDTLSLLAPAGEMEY